MKPSIWVCLIILFVCLRSEAYLGSRRTEVAYVTLLYGDEFLLGVRVLGRSIRDTGSTKDMVVLVSDGVSDYAKQLLQVIFSITLLASLVYLGTRLIIK